MTEYSEIDLLLVGGLISIISTLTVYSIQELLKWLKNNKGKLKIYTKIVYNKINGSSWGSHETSKGISFTIPLWIEIQNTKSKSMILRDLNLSLFRNGKKICSMKQINYFKSKNDTEENFFGDRGSYSFLIDPNSIRRYDLYFTIEKKSDIEFDEVRLGYYNSKDKLIERFLFNIEDPWAAKYRKVDEDWLLFK